MANLFKTVYDAIFNGKQQEDVKTSMSRDDAYAEVRVMGEYYGGFIGHSASNILDISNKLDEIDSQRLLSLYEISEQPFLFIDGDSYHCLVWAETDDMLRSAGFDTIGDSDWQSRIREAGYDLSELRKHYEVVSHNYDCIKNHLTELAKSENTVLYLQNMYKTGEIVKDPSFKEVVDNYFKWETTENKQSISDFIKQKAGAMLECMGRLPYGTIMGQSQKEGFDANLFKQLVKESSIDKYAKIEGFQSLPIKSEKIAQEVNGNDTSKDLNSNSSPRLQEVGNKLNEYEINLLNKIQKSGMYVGSDVTDDSRRLVDQLFKNDYKNLMSAYEKDDFGLIAEIQGTLRLKAGEYLESKGLLPLGTTEAELSSEGYKVDLLRSDINMDHERGAEQDKEFCNAVSKGDYALILDLHSKNYVPSEEVMNSLKNEGVSGNTLVAVEQIMGLNEPGKSLNDLQLEKNHDHGEGKSIGNTVDELFNNL